MIKNLYGFGLTNRKGAYISEYNYELKFPSELCAIDLLGLQLTSESIL